MVADTYFGRTARLIVGNKQIEGLTLSFRVVREAKDRADQASISVRGLSRETLGRLEDRETVVRLDAGYRGRVGQLVAGTIVPDSLSRGGPNEVTSFQVADAGYSLRNVVLSASWSGSVRMSTVARYIGDAIGAPLLDTDLPADPEAVRGYTLTGRAADALSDLARSFRCRYQVTNGRLVFVPTDERVPLRQRSLLLSPDTGLVGSPRAVDGGLVEVTALLQPQLLPGDTYRVGGTVEKAGDYRVTKVEHGGGIEGDPDFYSVIKGRILG